MKSALSGFSIILSLVACRDGGPNEVAIQQAQFSYSPPITVLASDCPPLNSNLLQSASLHRMVPISNIDPSLKFDPLSVSPRNPEIISLPNEQNQVSFEFDVVKTGQNLLRYQYIFQEYRNDWSTASGKKPATYGNLHEGEYQFKIKAKSQEGAWSEPIVYKFTVLPPWWRSWWAISSYSLVILSAVWLTRNQIVKRERLKNEIKLKRLEAEKYHELDALKSHFFANISHEFRTPLTLLLSPLEKRLSQANTPDEKAEFGIMHRNASRLLNLVNQLLDLSKLEAGSLKLKTVHGNLNTFIRSVSSQFSSMAQSRSIQFEVASMSQVDGWFDPDKLEKILVNLLSNAFKFTPSGGSIGISISSDDKYATIIVSDSGMGIPPDKINNIFDRFYQVDDSNLREYEGSGIGLSLVKELIELHHGAITASSNPGEGSCFEIKFPLGNKHLSDTEISEVSELKPGSHMRLSEPIAARKHTPDEEIPRVLIVEDNEDLRNYLLLSLRDKYNLIEASNGHQGLECAIREIPDLILSDLMMPKMDGLQLCVEIRRNEKTSHIPVILLTAKADQETKIDGLEIGADDYLAKPFNLPELTARIHNLIESRKKLRKLYTSSIILKPSDIKVNSLDDRFIKRVMDSIEEHLSDPTFSVEVLADEVAMSSVQVYRKLKAITGQTPNDLIRSIRLERAASLLIQQAGHVADVAYMVGFNNLSYFAKCFRDKFQKSPSEFLKKNNVTV
jgi:signal transduction histidine kinase/DNA-binding response OmpR family regulator